MTTIELTVPKHWTTRTDTMRYVRDDNMAVCFDVFTVFPDLTFEEIDQRYPMHEASHVLLVISCLNFDKPSGPRAVMKALDRTREVITEYKKGKHGVYKVQSNPGFTVEPTRV